MCYLCASRISKSRIAILKIYPVFTPQSPSNFDITNFCDIKDIYVLFEYLRAELLFWKFTLVPPWSHPLILALPVIAISKNVIALHLCASYVLFKYLRAEPLFIKFILFSPLSCPLILASPIFAISKNVITLHLCAFYVRLEYLKAESQNWWCHNQRVTQGWNQGKFLK